jgi:hypothetical protein
MTFPAGEHLRELPPVEGGIRRAFANKTHLNVNSIQLFSVCFPTIFQSSVPRNFQNGG